MNTFQLSCFLAVAETLSFARAAEQLHVTQPAVTQQIHSLEKELDAVLFRRTTRSVKLTPEGAAFFTDARQIVALTERARHRLQDPKGREFQVLSLGCGEPFQLFWISSLLEQLRSALPQLHPRLCTEPIPRLFRMLEDGDLDALLSFRVSHPPKGDILYRETGKAPLVCLLPRRHPMARESSLDLRRLRGERLVLLTPAKPQPEALHTLLGRTVGERTPAELYFCESMEAVAALVGAGYGAALLPDLFPPEELPFARVPLEGAVPVSFGVYYRPRPSSAALREFLRLVGKNGALPV